MRNRFPGWPRRPVARASRARARRLVYRSLATLNVGDEISVEHVTLPIPQLPAALDGYRVVQVSDLHLYPFTTLAFITRALEIAQALAPDLLVLTGDFVTHEAAAITELKSALGRLNARDGVHATLGNHDHWSNPNVVRAGLRDAGVNVLHNQSIPLGGGGAHLTGLDDGWVGRADFGAALEQAPGDGPIILLVHEPDLIDVFAQNPRVALQLSGHTHGGQVRLREPRRAYTLPFLGRKYDMGLYRVADAWLYTNRGIGTVIAPIRVNCPAEVTEFTLTAEAIPAAFSTEPQLIAPRRPTAPGTHAPA